jgi:hypothetical protein
MHGNKNIQKTGNTTVKRKDVARLVAEVHGVSPRYVRMVMNAERENEAIIETYMQIVEQDNALLQAVKKAVPL